VHKCHNWLSQIIKLFDTKFKKKKKKKLWRHIKTPMTIPSILLEKFQIDKSKDTK
jgi:hypothetical protein